MTKKAAALLLAASLAVSVCATPVFATGTSLSGSKGSGPSTTEVKYEVTESYEWSVPALIDFGENAGPNAKRVVNTTSDANGTITPSTGDNGTAPKVIVTKNVISGKFLKITLEPAGGSTDFSVKNAKGVELKYTVTLTDTTIGSDVKTPNREIGTTGTEKTILAVPAGTNTAEAKLKFELSTATTGTSEKAGTYTGKVQFTASIEPTT